MARRQCETVCGVEIPPEEQTPLVEWLLRLVHELQAENRRLREEIDRLKGLPGRPKLEPSTLNEPRPDGAAKKPKRRQRKRPGSAKRFKTRQLPIHETIVLPPDNLPAGAVPDGYKDFVVQDLVLCARNIRYRRACYELPDGTHVTAPLPAGVNGHFGPTLRSYVLYQHYQNHVTQPLIREELLELGVDISAGQINRLLTEGHERFHKEKDSLLPAAREVSRYFHTDDTSARHRGQNGHCTHIGNEWFASFSSTPTKSRINFLKILQAPYCEYVVDGDALFYMEYHGLSQSLLARLTTAIRDGRLIVTDELAWEERLAGWRIASGEQRRIVTEAALFGSLLYHDLYMHQVLISDDAGQFKVLGLTHGLCWVHAERAIRQLVPLNERERQAQERVQGAIWKYYQRLKGYRESPAPRRKARLDRDFDRLFTQRTGFPALNEALLRLHAKKEHLLMVLEYPEIPLHNNLSESDLREWAKKRKISAGTRSDLGRRCRDTFLSLKKTCRKLGVSFWQYLQDRISGRGAILPFPELIRTAAQQT